MISWVIYEYKHKLEKFKMYIMLLLWITYTTVQA